MRDQHSMCQQRLWPRLWLGQGASLAYGVIFVSLDLWLDHWVSDHGIAKRALRDRSTAVITTMTLMSWWHRVTDTKSESANVTEKDRAL